MEKQQRRAPLLYISQPDIQAPKVKMQEIYSLKKMGKKKLEPEKAPEKPENGQKAKDKDSIFQRVKPFKEMNIQEKIYYLENFPEQLSPVACIFEEKGDKQIRGYFLGKENNVIKIRLPDQKEAAVKIEDLTNIRLTGLN